MDAAREVADLDERLLGVLVRDADELRGFIGRPTFLEAPARRPRSTARETSRACAPSWRSRSICRRSPEADETARSRCAASRSDAFSSSRRVGPSRPRMTALCTARRPRMIHGVSRRSSEAAAERQDPLEGVVELVARPEEVPAVVLRDGEVPDRGGDEADRDRPADHGDDEEHEPEWGRAASSRGARARRPGRPAASASRATWTSRRSAAADPGWAARGRSGNGTVPLARRRPRA